MMVHLPSGSDFSTKTLPIALPYIWSGQPVVTAPNESGVHALLGADSCAFLYVGASQHLGRRLNSHAARSWDARAVEFYYTVMAELTVACQRLEIENDLVGAFFETTGMYPVFQR